MIGMKYKILSLKYSLAKIVNVQLSVKYVRLAQFVKFRPNIMSAIATKDSFLE